MRKASIREKLMRAVMPYGRRVYPNGTEELFNRRYETIFRKGDTGDIPVNEATIKEFYYDDGCPPWVNEESRRKCEDVLRRWASS